MRTTSFLILLLLFVGACKKKDDNNTTPIQPDYFVFGVTGGFCGDCYHYYKIENNNIYQDSLVFERIFHKIPMSSTKYQLAQPLLQQFPSFLKNDPNKTYGCPSCADQRSFYIEYLQNSDTLKWYIDEIEETQPAPIRPYIQQMNTILTQLQ